MPIIPTSGVKVVPFQLIAHSFACYPAPTEAELYLSRWPPRHHNTLSSSYTFQDIVDIAYLYTTAIG
jgi:hypothetical protein